MEVNSVFVLTMLVVYYKKFNFNITGSIKIGSVGLRIIIFIKGGLING